MNIEYIILVTSWIVIIGLLIKYIPKNKLREAQVAFFIKQSITWFFGLLVVEFRLIEYPVRFFSYANRASFTFEFLIFPALCAIFNVNYPEKKTTLHQFIYYIYYCAGITVVESILEKYTNVITYINWSEFLTFVTLYLTFYITRKYYEWFFKLK